MRLTDITNKRTAKNAKTALYWLPPMRRTAAASKKPNMQHIDMNNQDPRKILNQFEVIFRIDPYVRAIHKLNSRWDYAHRLSLALFRFQRQIGKPLVQRSVNEVVMHASCRFSPRPPPQVSAPADVRSTVVVHCTPLCLSIKIKIGVDMFFVLKRPSDYGPFRERSAPDGHHLTEQFYARRALCLLRCLAP